MWKDALKRSDVEASAWPYEWVQGVDYPHKDRRGTVSGQIALDDPQAPAEKMTNLFVGLSAPDYATQGFRGQPAVDWQLDAKYYEFWVRASADGTFSIPNVRPGHWTLHAIADGVLGEFAKADINLEAGKSIDLGKLTWTPQRFGKQLWEVGTPDRTGKEFKQRRQQYV